MRKKKELLESAPWRGEEDKFEGAKLRGTRQPGSGAATMYVPGKKSAGSADDEDAVEIDPELRYSFQRNFQVLLSPLLCEENGCLWLCLRACWMGCSVVFVFHMFVLSVLWGLQ